jgi:hypothetical protein
MSVLLKLFIGICFIIGPNLPNFAPVCSPMRALLCLSARHDGRCAEGPLTPVRAYLLDALSSSVRQRLSACAGSMSGECESVQRWYTHKTHSWKQATGIRSASRFVLSNAVAVCLVLLSEMVQGCLRRHHEVTCLIMSASQMETYSLHSAQLFLDQNQPYMGPGQKVCTI